MAKLTPELWLDEWTEISAMTTVQTPTMFTIMWPLLSAIRTFEDATGGI